MSELSQVFDFEGQGVRVVSIDGRPWFVARDVATVLGYVDATNAIKAHCRGVANHHPIADGLGRMQQTRVIPEPDVLRMITSSRLPSAERFERWVFETVLPAVLRTGRFETAPVFDVPQTFADALALAAAQQRELEQAAPKAAAWDDLVAAPGDYSVADAAKMLTRAGIETGQQRLFARMEEFGWIFRRGGRWQAMQRFVDSGYLTLRAQSHRHPSTGETVQDAAQIRVTMRGVERLRERLLPPIEALTG